MLRSFRLLQICLCLSLLPWLTSPLHQSVQAQEKPSPLKIGSQHLQFTTAPTIDLKVGANPLCKKWLEKFTTESFQVHVPKSYSADVPHGLVVYVHSGDNMSPSWRDVLEKRKLIWIGAQKVGNKHDVTRRAGLSHLGALRIIERMNIDADRIYTAGNSGGARIAGHMAFLWPEIYKGSVMSVGASFHRKIPEADMKLTDDKKYVANFIPIPPANVPVAKAGSRFVLFTGPKDFRFQEIQDIFNEGYMKDGFKAKLIASHGGGHRLCNSPEFKTALDFIEQK